MNCVTLDSVFCNTETIQFIPLGYDYILLGGSLIDTISVDSILENSITVVDQNGCSVSDSIKIRLDFYDSTILLPVDSTCRGSSKQFFIDSSYISSISWSLNGSQYVQDVYSINAFDTGVYKAEILSINGCSYEDSIKNIPASVGIASTGGGGTINPINPPLKLYKDSTVTFNLTDSSLSHTIQNTSYSSFEFK